MRSGIQFLIEGFTLGVLTTLFIGSFFFRTNIVINSIQKVILTIIKWIQGLWYAILFTISTIYVIANFETCKKFTLLSDFDGDNVIFLVWLIMLILPFFEKFEAFGISYKWRQNNISTEAARQAMDRQNILTVEELQNIQHVNSHEQ